MSVCEHDPPLALNNFNEIGTSVLYNLDPDSYMDQLTATLVITVDGMTLLYVGYSDESEHSLAAVSSLTDSPLSSCMPSIKNILCCTATGTRYCHSRKLQWSILRHSSLISCEGALLV